MIWLACQPPEGRGKDGLPGLGWTVAQAIKHTPQQLEFALADLPTVKGLVREMSKIEAEADGKTIDDMKRELEESRKKRREFFTGKPNIE